MTSKTCNLNRRNFLKTGTAGLTLLMSGAAGSRLAAGRLPGAQGREGRTEVGRVH